MKRFLKKHNTESDIIIEPDKTERTNNTKPLIVDGLTRGMELWHDKFDFDSESIKLILSVTSSHHSNKTVGKLCLDFGEAVIAHRIGQNSVTSTTEDMILEFVDNNPDYVSGAPILITDSEFLDWYSNTYRTDKHNIVHFLVYSVEYYYEFILNALPEITFVKIED
ncbi:MAG: hypothetical protein J6Q83_00380 [Clostridia bacterium]|nr:hypothetical protein [Clostridia bacterium]